MENLSPVASGTARTERIRNHRKRSGFGRESSFFLFLLISLLELFCFFHEREQPFETDAQVDGAVRFHGPLEMVNAFLKSWYFAACMGHGLVQYLEIHQAFPSFDGGGQQGA